MKPTKEDMARDLAADLKTCEAARPGPWTHEYFAAHDQHDVAHGPPDDASERFSILEELTSEDAELIAEARQGWPAAIRRAMAAEAEVQRLTAYEGLKYKCGCAAIRSDKIKAFCPKHCRPLEDDSCKSQAEMQHG
jgi:hypothetical protein